MPGPASAAATVPWSPRNWPTDGQHRMDDSPLSEEHAGRAFGRNTHALPDGILVDRLGRAVSRQHLAAVQFDLDRVPSPDLGHGLGMAELLPNKYGFLHGIVLRLKDPRNDLPLCGEGRPWLRRAKHHQARQEVPAGIGPLHAEEPIPGRRWQELVQGESPLGARSKAVRPRALSSRGR